MIDIFKSNLIILDMCIYIIVSNYDYHVERYGHK